MNRIKNRLGPKDLVVRAGFLHGATYPNGTPVAMVAAIQNFGAPKVGVPARPFFTNMVKANKAAWGPAMSGLLIHYDYDARTSLSLMGEIIADQLRMSIIEMDAPALSSVTVMMRYMRANWSRIGKGAEWIPSRTLVAMARQRVAEGRSMSGVSIKPLIDTGYMLSRIGTEVK